VADDESVLKGTWTMSCDSHSVLIHVFTCWAARVVICIVTTTTTTAIIIVIVIIFLIIKKIGVNPLLKKDWIFDRSIRSKRPSPANAHLVEKEGTVEGHARIPWREANSAAMKLLQARCLRMIDKNETVIRLI
jgi:hypothetical protein